MVGRRIVFQETVNIEKTTSFHERSLNSISAKSDIGIVGNMAQATETSPVDKPQAMSHRSSYRRAPSLPLQVSTRQRERAKEAKENGTGADSASTSGLAGAVTAPIANGGHRASFSGPSKPPKQRTASVATSVGTVESVSTESSRTESEGHTPRKKRGRPPKEKLPNPAEANVDESMTIKGAVRSWRKEQYDETHKEDNVQAEGTSAAPAAAEDEEDDEATVPASQETEQDSPNFRRSTRHRVAPKKLEDTIQIPRKRKRSRLSIDETQSQDMKDNDIDYADQESVGRPTSSGSTTSYDAGHTTGTDDNGMDIDEDVSSQASVVPKRRGRKPKSVSGSISKSRTVQNGAAGLHDTTDEPKKRAYRKRRTDEVGIKRRPWARQSASHIDLSGDESDVGAAPPTKRRRRQRRQTEGEVATAADVESAGEGSKISLVITLPFKLKRKEYGDIVANYGSTVEKIKKKRGRKSAAEQELLLSLDKVAKVPPAQESPRSLKRKSLHNDPEVEQQVPQAVPVYPQNVQQQQQQLQQQPLKLKLKTTKSQPSLNLQSKNGGRLAQPLKHEETIEFTSMAQKLRQQEVMDTLASQATRKPTKEEVMNRVEHLKSERQILADGIAEALGYLCEKCQDDITHKSADTDMLLSSGFEPHVTVADEHKAKKIRMADAQKKYQTDNNKEMSKLRSLQIHQQYAMEVSSAKEEMLRCLKLQKLKWELLLNGEAEDSERMQELQGYIDAACASVGCSEYDTEESKQTDFGQILVRGLGSTRLPYSNEETLRFNKKTGKPTNAKWDPSFHPEMRAEFNAMLGLSEPARIFQILLDTLDEGNLVNMVDAVQAIEGARLEELTGSNDMDVDEEETNNDATTGGSEHLNLLAQLASAFEPMNAVEEAPQMVEKSLASHNALPAVPPEVPRQASPVLQQTLVAVTPKSPPPQPPVTENVVIAETFEGIVDIQQEKEDAVEKVIEASAPEPAPQTSALEPEAMEVDETPILEVPKATEERAVDAIIVSEAQVAIKPTVVESLTPMQEVESLPSIKEIAGEVLPRQLSNVMAPIQEPVGSSRLEKSIAVKDIILSTTDMPKPSPPKELTIKTEVDSEPGSMSIMQMTHPTNITPEAPVTPITARDPSSNSPSSARRSKSASVTRQTQRPSPLQISSRTSTPQGRRKNTMTPTDIRPEIPKETDQGDDGLGQSITVSTPTQLVNNVLQGPKSADLAISQSPIANPPIPLLQKTTAPRRRRSEASTKSRTSSVTQLATIAPNYAAVEAKPSALNPVQSQALPPIQIPQLSPMEPSATANCHHSYYHHPDPYVSAHTHPLYTDHEPSDRSRRSSSSSYAPGIVLSGPPAPPPRSPRQRPAEAYSHHPGSYPATATFPSHGAQHSWLQSSYADPYHGGSGPEASGIDSRMYHRHNSVPHLPSLNPYHHSHAHGGYHHQAPSYYTHHQPHQPSYPPSHHAAELPSHHIPQSPQYQSASPSYYGQYPPRPVFGAQAAASQSPNLQNSHALPYPPPHNSSVAEHDLRRYSYFHPSPSQTPVPMYSSGNPSPSPAYSHRAESLQPPTPIQPASITASTPAPRPTFQGEPHKVYIGDGKYKVNTAPPSNEVRPPPPGTVFQFDRYVQRAEQKFAEKNAASKDDTPR